MLEKLKNMNRFKVVCVLTSMLYLYLFVSLLLFPESFCRDLGITGSESLYFLARRASALMLGFSVLLFLARNVPPSAARQAIALSVGVNMAAFALLGSFEWIRGFVNKSILSAIVTEVLVAVFYFSFFISDRCHAKKRDGAMNAT